MTGFKSKPIYPERVFVETAAAQLFQHLYRENTEAAVESVTEPLLNLELELELSGELGLLQLQVPVRAHIPID